MEKKYVYDVYDKIAPHFSHTRYGGYSNIFFGNTIKGEDDQQSCIS